MDVTAKLTLTTALTILVRMVGNVLTWWLATNASVPVDSTALGASPTSMNALLSHVSTVVSVRMVSTNTYANARMGTKGNAARMRLIYANPTPANMEDNATLFSIPTPANVNLVSKARIARSIPTIVFCGHAKMTGPVLIISMISFAFANLLLLARLARRRWTLASATIVPMEPPAHPTPTTKITRAPVLWDSLVGSAKKTLMSVR